MTQPPTDIDLATAIVAVYRAPLEEFIRRRDELAKQLRSEKRRDDAALVKALRKPSRIAWTLDGVIHEDSVSIDRLAAAIAEAQTGADLRTALEAVKEAVREVAAAGARVAVRAEHPIEPSVLVGAVQAIIGDENAFADLRAGRLVDVPEGGGLNLLFALAANAAHQKPPTSSPKPAQPKVLTPIDAVAPAKPDPRIALAAAARTEMVRAEKAHAVSREQSADAEKLLRDAKGKLEAAERALVAAQAEAEARRHDVDRAQRHSQTTATSLEAAQRAVADARRRLAELI